MGFAQQRVFFNKSNYGNRITPLIDIPNVFLFKKLYNLKGSANYY